MQRDAIFTGVRAPFSSSAELVVYLCAALRTQRNFDTTRLKGEVQ